jgi:hypothetical protein
MAPKEDEEDEDEDEDQSISLGSAAPTERNFWPPAL